MTDAGDAFVSQARSLLKSDYFPRIERCLESLTEEDIWSRANAEVNSIGNLMLHLSGNARQWIVGGVGGAPDLRARQEEFDARNGPPRAQLLSILKQTLDEVDAVLADLPSSRLLETLTIQGFEVTVMSAIFHVVEHFSMHTGQIIYITKQLTARDLHFYDL